MDKHHIQISPILLVIQEKFDIIKTKLIQQKSLSNGKLRFDNSQTSSNFKKTQYESAEDIVERLKKTIEERENTISELEENSKRYFSGKGLITLDSAIQISEIQRDMNDLQGNLISLLMDRLKEIPGLADIDMMNKIRKELIKHLLVYFIMFFVEDLVKKFQIKTIQDLPSDLNTPDAINIQKRLDTYIINLISSTLNGKTYWNSETLDGETRFAENLEKYPNKDEILKIISRMSQKTLNLHYMLGKESGMFVIKIPAVGDEYDLKIHTSNNLEVKISDWKTASLQSEDGKLIYIKAAVDVKIE